MASSDLPESPAEAAGADLGQTLEATEGVGPHVAAVPLADVPIYRPRKHPRLWSFVAAFVLAAVFSAGIAWLVMR